MRIRQMKMVMVLETPVITVYMIKIQTRGMMMVIRLGMTVMRMMIMMERVSTHYLNPARVLFLFICYSIHTCRL